MKLGVGSSSAMSFRYDLHSVRSVARETLRSNDLFAQAPPTGGSTYGQAGGSTPVLAELNDAILTPEDSTSMMPKPRAATTPSRSGPSVSSTRPTRCLKVARSQCSARAVSSAMGVPVFS